MTYRSHHVLADAESNEGIVLEEDVLPLLGCIDRFLEPSIPERESLVSGEFRSRFTRRSAHSQCISLSLESVLNDANNPCSRECGDPLAKIAGARVDIKMGVRCQFWPCRRLPSSNMSPAMPPVPIVSRGSSRLMRP